MPLVIVSKIACQRMFQLSHPGVPRTFVEDCRSVYFQVHPWLCFGEIKEKSIFREYLPIIGTLRKSLLKLDSLHAKNEFYYKSNESIKSILA